MENVTWSAVVVAVLGTTGVLGGIITAASFISARIDKRKQEKIAEAQKKLSDAVELQKIVADAKHINDESIKEAIWNLLKEREKEVDALKFEIKELQNVASLSRPRVTQIYTAVRELRKQIDILDTLVMKQTDHSDLAEELEILRQKLDGLERILP